MSYGPSSRGGYRNTGAGPKLFSPGMASYGVPAGAQGPASIMPQGFMDALKSWLPDMGNAFDQTNNMTGITDQGWVSGAFGGLKSIGDMYSSMKQFGLAEDQFEEGKRQYDQNYQAQVKNYNADLEDRQRARVASNSGGYQSVSDYMAKNRQV